MTSIPPHDLKLRDIVVEIISKHLCALVKQGEILQLTKTFGALGSAIIARLVASDRVMGSEEEQDSVLSQMARKLNARRSCRHCGAEMNVRMENGEYQYGTFRCASCHTRH